MAWLCRFTISYQSELLPLLHFVFTCTMSSSNFQTPTNQLQSVRRCKTSKLWNVDTSQNSRTGMRHSTHTYPRRSKSLLNFQIIKITQIVLRYLTSHQYTCDTLKPYHHSFASYKSPCQIMATSLNAFYLPMVVKAEDFLSPTAQLLQLGSWLLDGLNVMPQIMLYYVIFGVFILFYMHIGISPCPVAYKLISC
jgi:hypothetical protein